MVTVVAEVAELHYWRSKYAHEYEEDQELVVNLSWIFSLTKKIYTQLFTKCG